MPRSGPRIPNAVTVISRVENDKAGGACQIDADIEAVVTGALVVGQWRDAAETDILDGEPRLGRDPRRTVERQGYAVRRRQRVRKIRRRRRVGCLGIDLDVQVALFSTSAALARINRSSPKGK